MLMDITLELTMALKAIYATALGAFIGIERQARGRAAGIRTYSTVVLGACVFGLVSFCASDTTRIAAQVVTGIGFPGAGVIIRHAGRITGLTTAATMWTAAAIGLAIAFGLYVLATVTALLIFALSTRVAWANGGELKRLFRKTITLNKHSDIQRSSW